MNQTNDNGTALARLLILRSAPHPRILTEYGTQKQFLNKPSCARPLRPIFPVDVAVPGKHGAPAEDLEADVAATVSVMYQSDPANAIGKPAVTANVRARGVWFGPAHRAPSMPRDPSMLSQADFDALVAAFQATGFRGAHAYYMKETANLAYAAEAPNGGRLNLPVLFLHAAWDAVCGTIHRRLADPMRADCDDLTEVTIDGGHKLMLERPAEVNAAIYEWLDAKALR